MQPAALISQVVALPATLISQMVFSAFTLPPNNQRSFRGTCCTTDCACIYEEVSQSTVFSGHFQMPYELVRGGIEHSLQEKYKCLKQYIRRMEKQKGCSLTSCMHMLEGFKRMAFFASFCKTCKNV